MKKLPGDRAELRGGQKRQGEQKGQDLQPVLPMEQIAVALHFSLLEVSRLISRTWLVSVHICTVIKDAAGGKSTHDKGC